MTFLTIACNWLLGEDCDENMYKKIEMIPEPLASSNDPLSKSIVAAFVARKNYLSRDVNMKSHSILAQLNYASHLLMDSLTLTSCKKRDNLVLVSKIKSLWYDNGNRWKSINIPFFSNFVTVCSALLLHCNVLFKCAMFLQCIMAGDAKLQHYNVKFHLRIKLRHFYLNIFENFYHKMPFYNRFILTVFFPVVTTFGLRLAFGN